MTGAAAPTPTGVVAEIKKQRRWVLALLVLMVGGGAAVSRVRTSRQR
jgi:hypothetical protein